MKRLWLMEEMTVVGTSILVLHVALLGVLEVDSCPPRKALGPGLGVKAPHFPHQLALCRTQPQGESSPKARANTEENLEANLSRGPLKSVGCPA